MLKFLFFLPFVFLISNSYGATCTNTTRTNYSSNQVLTSSALNADFNQLVTKANALDGGCVTDGTLEYTALDSSLDAVKNGIHQGCIVSYTDANTVAVGKCITSVNGTFVKTIISTSVTWGCSSCSAEANSTQYYVYAKTGSTGTTLNLLISTVAPGTDGYDASGNKVLGRFFNNSAGAINQYQIDSWNGSGYSKYDGIPSTPGLSQVPDIFSFAYGKNSVGVACDQVTCFVEQIGAAVTSFTRGSAGTYTVTFPRTYNTIHCTANAFDGTNPSQVVPVRNSNAATVAFSTKTSDSVFAAVDTFGTVICFGY